MTAPLFTRDGKHLYALVPPETGRYWGYHCALCGALGRGEGRRRALHAYHQHWRRRHA